MTRMNIGYRLRRLEKAFGGGKRLIVCCVRDGYEDEDRAEALAAAAVTPSDLVVIIRKFCHEATDGPFVPTVISIQSCIT